jgi:hypothetical protein
VLAEVNKAEPRRRPSKRPQKQELHAEEQESREPELTAFQIAFQKAQERAEGKHAKAKKSKAAASEENEEIFDRTLKNRLPTG